jgi:DNA-cytosine methyltransferase
VKYVELFAGVGGFRVGFEAAGNSREQGGNQDSSRRSASPAERGKPQLSDGFVCVFANEFDKYARSVYRYHFGDIDGRDIRDVPADEIPDADLWTFGAPCQDFSVAGRRAGLEGDRGNLFLYTLELLALKRPRYFLAENVPGLLSIDGGRAFAHIVGTIAQMGYDCQWVCVNSKDFGVPQNRERLFLVGSARGEPRPEIFSFENGASAVQETGVGESAGCLGSRSGSGQSNFDRSTTLIATLPTASNHGPQGIDEKHRQGVVAIPVLTPGRINKRQNGPRFRRIRRLTPLECERLQAFPDNWTARGIDDKGDEVQISDSQRYRQMGNAVTTSVIAHFARALAESEGL